MRLAQSRNFLSLVSLFALLLSLNSVTFSADIKLNSPFGLTLPVEHSGVLMLAESENKDADDEQPRSGSLVLPAATDEDKSEKKCMTVCQRWGEECMIDTTRGVRKCRRTCKEFGQECF